MKKVTNFRDLATAFAGSNVQIKRGLLFRSGHFDRVKGSCKEFKEPGLKTLIDLRLKGEGKAKRFGSALNVISLPLGSDRDIRVKIKPLVNKKGVEREIAEIFTAEYGLMPEKNREQVARLFSILTDEANYPLVFHCRAGKDRTGFIAALLQLTLGLDEERIIDDYLHSNRHYLPKIQKGLKLVRLLTLGLFRGRNIEYIVTVRREYIEALISTINERYGGVRGYLKSCGVTDEAIERFREVVLCGS